MTVAERIESLLRRGGIAPKSLWQSGRTGAATFWSFDTASKAARVFQSAGFRVRGPIESRDYAKENKNTVLRPSTIKVWSVGFYLN